MAWTDSLRFGEVCLAIGKSIQPTDWPVLVSMECHVPLEQQKDLVYIMKNAWGDKLVDKALEGVDASVAAPSDFRGRILLMIEYASLGLKSVNACI